jgi:outer membrane receptor for monomeric catechols
MPSASNFYLVLDVLFTLLNRKNMGSTSKGHLRAYQTPIVVDPFNTSRVYLNYVTPLIDGSHLPPTHSTTYGLTANLLSHESATLPLGHSTMYLNV